MPSKSSAAAPSFEWVKYTVSNPLPGCREVVVLDKKGAPIKWTRYASTSLAAIVLPSKAPAPASKTVYDPRLNGDIPVVRYQTYRNQIVKALEKGERVRTREEALAAFAKEVGQAGSGQVEEDEEEDEEDQLDGCSVRDVSPELAAGPSTFPVQEEEEEDSVNDDSDEDEDEDEAPKPKIRFSHKRYLIPAPLPNEQPVVVYDKSGNIVTEYAYSTDFEKIVLPRHVRGRDKKLKMPDGTTRKVMRWKLYKRRIESASAPPGLSAPSLLTLRWDGAAEKLKAGKHVSTAKEALARLKKASSDESDDE
ncbi:hypothetical protein NBRC10512_001427 [Rhodotorula toruloides]|uniref:RHTO0S19e03114g1_1 n=1 Tax=Rhodotorula toruloides TaxID=5286 RepID=A0A061BH80_RHOTO|nr:RHTO0S19e03114g1_1 [Rhodotorula toruloides]